MLSLFMAELKARSLSIAQAAKEMGINEADLIKQLETVLSQNAVEKISALLGTSAEIWLNLSARQQAIEQGVIDMGLESGGWANEQ
jgi:plasmid maintenance system antidote protein VapI